ncbi:MAG: hypothetical protein AB1810_01635 [Pseudomonadota bacterium]
MTHTLFRQLALPVALGAILVGCAGNDNNDSTATPTTTISGVAVAGAVTGTVSVRDGAGAELATAAVTNGAFSVAVPDAALSGELDFVVTGAYSDEVSGDTVTLGAAHPLALRTAAHHFQAGQLGNAPVTPDTTVIRALAAGHGMTLAAAQTAFESAFGYLPDLDAVPFDPKTTSQDAANARTQADKDAAFRAGLFSQLAHEVGLSGDDIAGLPAALADDLSDDDLDGVDGTGNPVTIGAVNLEALHHDSALPFRLLKAHAAFVGNAAANQAGLSAPAMLPPVSYDAAGAAKTITTPNGRHITVALDTVADAPFITGFWTARVRHRLTLIDADTQQPVDITTDPDIVGLGNHPMMYMLNGHDHTTPHGHDPDTSAKAQGQYVLDNYYVMASAMANGTPMGVWDYVAYVKEDADGDRATTNDVVSVPVIFHPQVKMTMGSDVLSVSASNANDQWTNMMGMNQARGYRLWLHAVEPNNAGGHDLTVFVSTQNIANPTGSDPHAHTLSFPSVRVGRVLQGVKDASSGLRPDVTLATVTVEVSLDNGASWQPLVADGTTGRYTITALSGLSTTAANTVQLKLTVNGNAMATAAGAYPALIFTAP